MPRYVFHTFHYQRDFWRVQTIKQIGSLERQKILNSNEWEEVKRQGDAAIQRWIDGQMQGKSCDIVLIGSQTAGRKWINYEILKAWHDGKGVLGVYIHNLKDQSGFTSPRGVNPFSSLTVKANGQTISLDKLVPVYDPGYSSGTAYAEIAENLESWVEDAIKLRKHW
ncbi:TIR domain-containing protein [Mangrovactinospora gilvigrisea]|uniref:TIR domain-containing protein n=1 Tax=Mangrovactinospora gilvigrisea TaxID=1428644 RepID=UPI0008FC6CF6|nr:TIR domain-containing protein [Mangrovactinospora gilvigrisea]